MKIKTELFTITIFICYTAVVSLLFAWYKSQGTVANEITYLPYLVQAFMFLVICMATTDLRRLVFCAFAIVFLACTYSGLHFYFSKNDPSLDWKGFDGAIAMFMVQGFISLFISLIALGCAVGITKIRGIIRTSPKISR